jgi:CheY-like chemotaxis protein
LPKCKKVMLGLYHPMTSAFKLRSNENRFSKGKETRDKTKEDRGQDDKHRVVRSHSKQDKTRKEPQTKVLITHVPEEQGVLWRAILESQGINAHFEVNWRIFNPNLLEYLKRLALTDEALPDMLMLDMGVKVSGSEELQSGEVCRWCSKHYPHIRIFLLGSNSDKVPDLAKRWGLRRGAVDVLPKLSRENLLISTVRVTSVLGCALSATPLKNIAAIMPSTLEQRQKELEADDETLSFERKIEQKIEQIEEVEEDRTQGRQGTNSAAINLTVPATQTQLSNDDFIIYRGVKVRKKKN